MIEGMPFFLLAGILIVLLLACIAYYRGRVRRVYTANWHELVARLNIVDRSCVEQIALDAIDESGQQRQDNNARQLEEKEIWNLVGGLEGLELLEQNSAVLIDIAAYVQQWYPEALETAEELRRNAKEMRWHVSRLKRAEESGNLEGWFANYAQNAIATYYLMTRRVLALYESKNLPMLTELQKTI